MLDEESKASIIDAVLKTLHDAYVFPEVAKEIEEHIHQQVGSSAYKSQSMLEEFAQALTNDLRSISKDNHLLVFPYVPSEDQPEEREDVEDEDDLDATRLFNHGFQSIEILSGNVGYINIQMFSDPLKGGPAAVAAMNFLAGVDALIIDLRDNGGGWGNMVALMCGYFFDESIHLTTNYYREGDITEQSWTPSFIPGHRLVETPLFILTSASTFSAAEEFAYTLKHLGRATIVGERSRGGAHPVSYRTFPELGIKVMVPNARSINPETKSNWQGTGVTPDIEVDADRARGVAYIEALQLLIRAEQKPERLSQLELAMRSAQASLEPVPIEASDLMCYTGQYGDTSIGVIEGKLHYQRDGRRSYVLMHLGDDLFGTRYDTLFVQFTRDESGEISGLTVTFYDGYIVHVDKA
jgi:hypothetical protein